MSEIAQYVHHGASRITPQILHGVYKKLPLLKVEFTQIHAPNFPHLVDQLEFLADVVEDFAEGKADDLSYVAVASAAFALIYAHRQMDIIPDSFPKIGLADESSIVRTVLIEHERVLAKRASDMGLDWASITIKA